MRSRRWWSYLSSYRSLGTKHSPLQVTFTKQRCHLLTRNDAPFAQDVLSDRKLLRVYPECVNYKKDYIFLPINLPRHGTYSTFTIFLYQCTAASVSIYSWRFFSTRIMSGRLLSKRLSIKGGVSYTRFTCKFDANSHRILKATLPCCSLFSSSLMLLLVLLFRMLGYWKYFLYKINNRVPFPIHLLLTNLHEGFAWFFLLLSC